MDNPKRDYETGQRIEQLIRRPLLPLTDFALAVGIMALTFLVGMVLFTFHAELTPTDQKWKAYQSATNSTISYQDFRELWPFVPNIEIRKMYTRRQIIDREDKETN